MVSHPETSSDSPIGSDRDRGRDNAHTSDLTRCYPAYEMHLSHFMLCHATCTIFINSG